MIALARETVSFLNMVLLKLKNPMLHCRGSIWQEHKTMIVLVNLSWILLIFISKPKSDMAIRRGLAEVGEYTSEKRIWSQIICVDPGLPFRPGEGNVLSAMPFG